MMTCKLQKKLPEKIATKYQCGVGMVEVLVTLVLLGVGLLGVLVMQTNGLSSNTRATFVTEAQYAAQDMADRILAFGSTASNGNAGANTGQYGDTDTNTNYVDPACAAAGCDATNTVAHDRFNWKNLLANTSLPAARGQVVWNDPEYTIRVMWDRDREGATGTDCASNDKKANLTCFEMQVRL